MIIIEENELYQTDSFEDILQHHGVKGMKWGQRMKRWGSAYGGLMKRKIKHPRLYSKAAYKSRVMTGSKLGVSSRHMEYRNRIVDDMVKANKQYKSDKRKALGKHDDGDERIFKKYANDAIYAKRDKKNGESKSDFRNRIANANTKMAKEYNKLNNDYDKAVLGAKHKRKQAYLSSGGKF